MSTIDTSTWNPDADLNTEIEGIPLNADAGIAQTWQALRVLMAAVKGDGDAIKAMIDVMQGATASADGASGLVPAPQAGEQGKFLRGDATWGVPTDTTYSNATQQAAGLMSAADKTKLDGLPTVSEMGTGYIRYSNGLQMCFETVTIATGTSTSSLDSSGNVYYGTKTVIFPKSFLTPPVVTIGGHDGGSGFYNATTSSVSETQVVIEIYGKNSGVTCTPGYFAIGEWS